MAIIAGIIALFVIVVAVELLGPVFHPIPAGMAPNDNAAFARWVATAPFAAQAVIVLAWLLGAIGGGWAALRISRWLPAVWIVAGLDVLMAVATILRFEHPLWMQIGAVAAPLLGGWIVTRLPLPAHAEADPISD